MLFTLTTTHQPATDLGYLLRKHPDRLHTIEMSYGNVQIAYPEASDERCTVALTVEIPFDKSEPVGDGYVSERPYVAGSFLPQAIRKAFSNAIAGNCAQRSELVDIVMPLEMTITPVVCTGRHTVAEYFEPLGYQVEDVLLPLDPKLMPDDIRHHRITLRGHQTLTMALRHVAVLLSVLDPYRHHYVGDEEIDKLNRLGEGWLETHPLLFNINARFLRIKSLVNKSLEQGFGNTQPIEGMNEPVVRLQDHRIAFARDMLLRNNVSSVVDLGCGSGDLLVSLKEAGKFDRLLGIDPSPVSRNIALKRLNIFNSGREKREKIDVKQGAAQYADERLKGFDAVTLLEVIEHLEPFSLSELNSNVFGRIAPRIVIITTPNRDWNATFTSEDTLRHRDHRFEFDRAEFQQYCASISAQYGYTFDLHAVGEVHGEYGPGTQAAVFVRMTAEQREDQDVSAAITIINDIASEIAPPIQQQQSVEQTAEG